MPWWVVLIIMFTIIIGVIVFIVKTLNQKRKLKDYERQLKLVPLLIHLPPSTDDIQGGGRDERDINDEAKNGNLVGTFKSLDESINAGLDENLERLVKYNILTQDVADKMKQLFKDNPLLQSDVAVLVHNDFADWNLLTDGNTITGVVDWDECVGGHPIQEIACWSTFFDPERITSFLEGYFSETEKYDNFDDLFQLFRLRYTISKMALRIKRYTYEQTPFLRGMIEKGEKHLEELSKIFHLDNNVKKKVKN